MPMNSRAMMLGAALVVAAATVPAHLGAQEHVLVRAASEAYDRLEFGVALDAARRAVTQPLSQSDLVRAYEILAFTYAAIDSTRQAVDAFRELIFLDPDREPNIERVSPRITSLYASALGQVLVVRGIAVDSATFVVGEGVAQIQFQVSRPARVFTRVIGGEVDALVDSQLVAGVGGFRWSAQDTAGGPLPPGTYTLLVTAREGSSEFTRTTEVRIAHGVVDTLPHITSLPGYSNLPETEVPPRDWRPVGVAFLYATLSTGVSFALSDTDLGTSWRTPAIGVSLTALAAGIAMTVKRPDPRPVPANIRYNQLLATQIAARNAEIAQANETRRRQTLLTVTAADGGGLR